jgi:CheY-like chemotaxis protein
MTHSVLVVDDDRDIRESMTEILADDGYCPLAAADGQDALERIRGLTGPPCLILLDMMMPVMDGWQFRRAQLEDRALRSIPIIVLTAHADADKIAKEVGAVGFLRKPVSVDALMATVERFCPRS